MNQPRRTADEWRIAAQIAPDVRSIFCEGNSDASLVSTATSENRMVDFRTADEIDIEVESTPLRGLNKAKIVALAERLRQLPNCRFLIDTDFDHMIDDVLDHENLVYTDGANIIAAYTDIDWLRNVVVKAFGYALTDQDWADLVSDLRFCFCSRFLAAIENPDRGAPEAGRYLQQVGERYRMDRLAYIQKFCGVQGEQRDEMLVRIRDAENGIGNHKFGINSNDLFSLTHSLFRKLKIIKNNFPKDAVRAILTATAPDDLGGGPNIMTLLAWVND